MRKNPNSNPENLLVDTDRFRFFLLLTFTPMATFHFLALVVVAATCGLALADPQQVMLQCSQAAAIVEEALGFEASNQCAKSCLSLHSLKQLHTRDDNPPPCRSVCEAYEGSCGVRGRCDRYPTENCVGSSGVADIKRFIQPWALGYRVPQGFPLLVSDGSTNSTAWKTSATSIYACYNWLYYLPIDCADFDWVSSSCMVVREFSPINCRSAGCCADFRHQMLFEDSGFHTEVSGLKGPKTAMSLFAAGYGCYSDNKPMYCASFTGASNQKCAVYDGNLPSGRMISDGRTSGYPRWQFDSAFRVHGVQCQSILGESARDQCCMMIESVWQSFNAASLSMMTRDSYAKKLADEMVFQF